MIGLILDTYETVKEYANDNPRFLTICLGISGFIVAWSTYKRNLRIKAAEILISLEKEYNTHVAVLVEIENSTLYNLKYKQYFSRINNHRYKLTEDEMKLVISIESAIRYFFLCSKLGKLGVDKGHIRYMSSYYLRVLVFETKENLRWHERLDPFNEKKYVRPELRKYMFKYWPSVAFWAPHSRRPWIARFCYYIGQSPYRFMNWLESFYD
ncbi:MAG: hypothetical protein WCJ40_20830 [Planctomycetota bacterium]